jgi:prepilin-type processing-associated H-X9-DG protein
LNNLKQFGLAMQNYHSAKETFPPGALMKQNPRDIYANANAALLPYFEQAALHNLYDQNEQWENQDRVPPSVASRVVPMFKCPSSSAPNTMFNDLMEIYGGPTFGVTEYAFCMGYTDAFCIREGVKPGEIPPSQQGMFNMAWGASIRQITDGTSNTIAMGDASGDSRWKVCHLKECTEADLAPGPLGEVPTAQIGWIMGEPNSTAFYGMLGPMPGIYGCTVEPINKSPITDTFLDLGQYTTDFTAFRSGATDHYCRPSYEGGRHTASNYRSDHPGGANFLMADGSVAFINETIAMPVYRARSTIGGEEVVLE